MPSGNDSLPAWQLLCSLITEVPSGLPEPDDALSSSDWDKIYATCLRHGLFPLVYRYLNRVSPSEITAFQRERFRQAAAACILRSLQMHKEMGELLASLGAAGIPAIPFKGPVLAERAYGDVCLRVFEDLDFLVPKEKVADAIGVIANHGYTPPGKVVVSGLAKLMTVTDEVSMQHSSHPWLVEIHWDFAKPWHCLKFSLDSLWAGIDPHATNGRLDDSMTILQLCVHGTSHYWDKIKWIVDLDRFVRNVPHLDWTELFNQAGTIGCTRAVLLGLFLANICLNLPLPATVMQELQKCKSLPWLGKFVMTGWEQSGEFKRPLLSRMVFILRCRESLTGCLMAIWKALAKSPVLNNAG